MTVFAIDGGEFNDTEQIETFGDVIEIDSAEGLKALDKQDGDYRLTADIALDENWEPIHFSGSFDGNGHQIRLNGKPVFQDLSKGSIVFNLLLSGEVSGGGSSLGALASTSSGTIRNIYSDVVINYSGWDTAGGLVGEAKEGKLSNCLVTAEVNTISGVDKGTIAGFDVWFSGTNHTTINNSYWTSDGDIAAPNATVTDSRKVEMEEVNSSQLAALLNRNLQEGDLSWGVRDDVLVPGGKEEPVELVIDKEALIQKIEYAQKLAEEVYTVDSWHQLNEALSYAEAIAEDQQATQKYVDKALQDLTEAIESLVKDLTVKVDRSELKAALSSAEVINDVYTSTTWTRVEEALTNAKKVDENDGASQEEIDQATSMLTDAVQGLKTRSLKAVSESELDIVLISTVAEFKNELEKNSNRHFQLENDLEIQPTDYWFGQSLQGILDGNGYTITLSGSVLFDSIGEDGLVQNLGIRGQALDYSSKAGSIAKNLSGLIINSWSLASVKSDHSAGRAGGLVSHMESGGAIVNSYAAGEISGKGAIGGLAGEAHPNSIIQTSYWLDYRADEAIGTGEGQLKDTVPKTEKEFRDSSFIQLLNEHNTGAKEWNLSAEGFPYHGENVDHVPEESIGITLTDYAGNKQTFDSEEGLSVSLLDVDRSNQVGTLSHPKAANWSIDYSKGKHIMVGAETGVLSVYKEGRAEVVVSDKSWNTLGKFTVVAEMDEVMGLRLTVNDKVIDDNLIIQGSEQVSLRPQVRVDDNEWKNVPAGFFEYTSTGSLRLTNNTFYATEPGEATVTAKGYGQSATIEVVSEHVPITKIYPAPNGEYLIHGRNGNSDSSGDFLDLNLSHQTGSVIVEPENASYRDRWTLTSSNPEIAEYVSSFLLAILPKKEGRVTLTVTSDDPMMDEQVSGTSEIELFYLNPLTKVRVEEEHFMIQVGEKINLPLEFIGTEEASAQGYQYVTEPGMKWTFEGDGKVNIDRETLGINVGQEGSKEYTIANDQYHLRGIEEGTVTVTGRPIDQTRDASPIEFTVTIGEGEAQEPVDIDALVTEGIKSAQDYLYTEPQSYEYGQEWDVFSQVRSGLTVKPHEIESYVQSVREVYSSNPNASDLKPTTIARVILTLSALGQDASTIPDVDFIKLLTMSDRMADGGNELTWALIALDSMVYKEPSETAWTRDQLMTTLIDKFQNPDSGGFGLTDNQSSGVDLTAMAIQSLAPYYDEKSFVKQSVDKALQYLQDKQTSSCGFDGNLEASAQVLVALTALGIDPLDEDNGFTGDLKCNLITNIMSFLDEDTGGFKHALNTGFPTRMSSIQALYSLNAYERFKNGDNRLYDLTDVVKPDLTERLVLENRLDEAHTLKKSDYTTKSWTVFEEAKAEAKKVLADETATLGALKEADNQLAIAIKGLVVIDTTPPPVETKETVTVTVDKKVIGEGYIVHPKEITLREGDTAFTVMERAVGSNSVRYTGSGSSLYVQSIDGLGEFDKGPKSGWMYGVNGTFPEYSAGAYKVKDGDEVHWQYTVDLGEDIGGGSGSEGDNETSPNPKPEEKPETKPEKDSVQVDSNKDFTLDEKYQADASKEVTLDFDENVTELPKVVASREHTTLEIPKGTKVTSKWDGKLLVPTKQKTSNKAIDKMNEALKETAQEISSIDTHIKVGGDQTIEFDQHVQLKFKGKAHLKAGLIHTDGKFETIGDKQTDDVYMYVDGKDLIIQTKHFTEFLLFEAIDQKSENTTKVITIRIEGVNETIYPKKEVKVTVEGSAVTALDATKEALNQARIPFEASGGFISKIGDEGTAMFGVWDGWQYIVNNDYASIGAHEYNLEDDDEVTWFYGNVNSLYKGAPEADTVEKLTLNPEITVADFLYENEKIEVKVTSSYDVYGEDFSVEKENIKTPIQGADVHFDGQSYKTDKNGIARIPADKAKVGTYELKVTKDIDNSYPRLLRQAKKIVIKEKSSEDSKPEPPVEKEETVTVSVETHSIGKGYIVHPKEITLREGDTAFTVMERALGSKSVRYTGSGASLYVQAIDGLGEFDEGPESGWMYEVKGKFPEYSAGLYEVKDGDKIRWRYTTNLGKDLEEDDDASSDDSSGSGGSSGGIGSSRPDPQPDKDTIEVDSYNDFTLDKKYQNDASKKLRLVFDKNINELPKVIAPREQTTLEIQKGTKIISDWDGKLLVPTRQKTSSKDIDKVNQALSRNSQKISTINTHIKVGGDKPIRFDQHVKLTFKGKAHLKAGLIDTNGKFELIGENSKDDVYMYVDGKDLIVQTKHFTAFLLFEPIEKTIEFKDVQDEWFKEFVEEAVRQGIFNGYEDGNFKPNQHLTRAQAASVLVRALDLEATNERSFKDIKGYAKETQAEIAAAAEYGLVKGYEDNNFKPGKKVRRSQLALMLYRAYEQKTGEKYIPVKIAHYSDIQKYDIETQNAISMLYELEIATGDNGKYNPGNSTTRAHASKMLVSFLEKIQ